jgi:hypothetical protein
MNKGGEQGVAGKKEGGPPMSPGVQVMDIFHISFLVVKYFATAEAVMKSC